MFVVVGVVGTLLLIAFLVFDDFFDGILPDAEWISGPAIGAFLAAFGRFGWVADDGFDAPPLLSAIDKMTVISTDGASDMTTRVASNVTQGVQLASDLLGVDLAAMFQRVANGDRTALTPPAPPAADDGAVANPV